MTSEHDEAIYGPGLARALVRRLDSVRDVSQRCALLAQYCDAQAADVVAAGLQALLINAVRGASRDAWLAMAVALCRGDIAYERLGALYRAAVDAEYQALRLVLIGGDTATRTAREGEFARDEMLENLSLGERKAKARCHDKDMLIRLLHDPNAAVVHILLRNRKVTETDVVRLAARRPNRPSVLREIALVPRWVSTPAVQRALVLNPYSPVRIPVTLLPLFSAQELHEVRKDMMAHALVREAAQALLDLRGWQAPTLH